jgi:hypothetical protein
MARRCYGPVIGLPSTGLCCRIDESCGTTRIGHVVPLLSFGWFDPGSGMADCGTGPLDDQFDLDLTDENNQPLWG